MFSPDSCISNPFPTSWLACYLYFIPPFFFQILGTRNLTNFPDFLGREYSLISTFWHEELNGNTNSEAEEMIVCFRVNMHEIGR